MNYDGLLDPFSGLTMAHGAATRQRAPRHHARGAGRVGGRFAAARRQSDRRRPVRRRDRPAARSDQGEGEARARRAAGAGALPHSDSRRRERVGEDLAGPAREPDARSQTLFAVYHGRRPRTLVDKDEPIRADTTVEVAGKLPPLDKDGTVTAGNAPGVNDGARRPRAGERRVCPCARACDLGRGRRPRGRFVGSRLPGAHARDGRAETARQARHDRLADRRLGSNEAFAAVAWSTANCSASTRKSINALGGAVALGHPIGASGARIVASVAHQLRRRGGGLGIAAICSGGGQGDAVLVKVG